MGLFDIAKENLTSSREGRDKIFVSTGTVNRDFKVIDCVFALDSHKGGLFSSAKPEEAFNGVKQELIDRCLELGGDAVLDCEFEYRVALAEGFVGKNQVIEIFAYGTVVKFL